MVVIQYSYDAWGNHSVEVINSSCATLANLNPFRYRSYYYDAETKLYFLQTRYYDPEVGRFITIDGIEYLDLDTINGLNLYAYCGNNPVMGYDPMGTWDWGIFWEILINIGASLIGIVVGVATAIAVCVTSILAGALIGFAVGSVPGLIAGAVGGLIVGAIAGVTLGIAAGIAAFGGINNSVNAIYYNYISDGGHSLSEEMVFNPKLNSNDYSDDSYQNRYISRWERLDYAKACTGAESYAGNAHRFYAEYSLHMYGWYLTGYTYNKGVPLLSELAKSCVSAEVNPKLWDHRGKIRFATRIFMFLGI